MSPVAAERASADSAPGAVLWPAPEVPEPCPEPDAEPGEELGEELAEDPHPAASRAAIASAAALGRQNEGLEVMAGSLNSRPDDLLNT
jgi:hypothetical protein